MNISNQTLQLKEGRILAYAEYGVRSGGKPVFFFHGTPGSRFFRPPDEITKRLGVRLISLTSPAMVSRTSSLAAVCWTGLLTLPNLRTRSASNEGEAHLLLFLHWEEILTQLTQE